MRASAAFILLVASLFGIETFSKEIVVGEGKGGWTLGVDYGTIEAAVGDELTFKYTAGVHDVFRLPSTACDFTAAGAEEVGTPAAGETTVKVDAPGQLIFACSVPGHCEAKQILTVNVVDGGSGAAAAPGPAPSVFPDEISGGRCSDPQTIDDGVVFVSCRGPGVALAPGDNIFPTVLLPNPYPGPEVVAEVILKTISADLVDATGRSVPLTEVYLHHIFGDVRFVPAEGAEMRRSSMRQALPEPFFLAVDTTAVAEEDSRFANFHVIRTSGVAPEELQACIECWCEGSQPPVVTGSIGCCYKCPTTSTLPPEEYYLEFNVTYVVPSPEGPPPGAVRTTVVMLDIHGDVEYNVAAASPEEVAAAAAAGIKPTSTYTRTYALDFFCPQTQNFSIVKCYGHQHIGAKCVSMVDEATGVEICRSCPEMGTQQGVAGDEEGYVVGMTATVLNPPYPMQPGQKVVLSSTYENDVPHAGVMSAAAVMLAGFDAREECQINYGEFLQPPAETASDNPDQVAAVVETVETRIEDIVPANCTSVRAFLDDLVTPCLPAAAGNRTPESVDACCAAYIASDDGALSALFTDIFTGKVDAACTCGLGEVLLTMTRQQLFSDVSSLFTECQPGAESGGDGITDTSISVAMNSVFAPRCPNIAVQLGAGVSAGNEEAQSPAGETPAEAPTPVPDITTPAPSGASTGLKTLISVVIAFVLCIFV